jgi:hypothetical protein
MILLYQVTNTSPVWYKDPTILATWIIAGFAAASAIAAFLMLLTTREYTKVTRDIFEAAYSPYIGISEVKIVPNLEADRFSIFMTIENSGSVPAHDFKFSFDLIDNDIPLLIKRPQTSITVLQPKMTAPIGISFDHTKGTKIIFTDRRLDLHVSIEYKGVTSKQFRYKYEARYDHQQKNFIPTRVSITQD